MLREAETFGDKGQIEARLLKIIERQFRADFILDALEGRAFRGEPAVQLADMQVQPACDMLIGAHVRAQKMHGDSPDLGMKGRPREMLVVDMGDGGLEPVCVGPGSRAGHIASVKDNRVGSLPEPHLASEIPPVDAGR